MHTIRWSRRLLGGAVLLVVLLVGGTAARIWQVGRLDHPHHADVLMVLGSTQANGDPQPILAARLHHARTLYEHGVAEHIITVGGKQPGDNYTEAQAGKMYLHQRGIPTARLLAVNAGNDTLHSIEAGVAAMSQHGWGSAVMVSDPWHEMRCRTMARDLGIKAWVSPTHSGPIVSSREIEVRYITRETTALLYYRMTHSGSEFLDEA
jgi:vancomycin permeability regulator SanA